MRPTLDARHAREGFVRTLEVEAQGTVLDLEVAHEGVGVHARMTLDIAHDVGDLCHHAPPSAQADFP